MRLTDGELQVTRDDTGLLVVAGGVTSQLEDLGSQVLEDGGEVDGGTGTDTLSIVALPQQTVDTTDGESETSLGRTAVKVRIENQIAKRRDRKTRMKNQNNRSRSVVEIRSVERDGNGRKTNLCDGFPLAALPPLPPEDIAMDLGFFESGRKGR
jgi:hypothetical protein